MESPIKCLIFLLLAVSCNGQDERIINGTDAEAPVPYFASCRDSSSRFICSGTIIRSGWILTSANCARRPITEVRVGSNSFNQGFPQIRSIRNKIIHPEFDYMTSRNDLALLQLNASLTFNDNVRAIRIASTNTTISPLTAYAWDRSRCPPRNSLQTITLGRLRNTLCSRLIGHNITFPLMCTYRQGSGLCRGDTGSPIVGQNVNRTRVLFGIASNVGGCGQYFPDILISVVPYSDWIREEIRRNQ